MAVTQLGNVEVGSIVRINENGLPVDFYVAKHNYESSLNGPGRTLLVRKDCYDMRPWDEDNNYSNEYSGTTIDEWLNGPYKNILDADIQEGISTTKFPYTTGGSNHVLTTLERSVFLLSVTEMGKTHQHANVEGSDLPIATLLEEARFNGEVVNFWTRTPYLHNESFVFRISGGEGHEADPSNSPYFNSHSRPIFTLPYVFYVLEDGTVITNSPPTAPGSMEVAGVVIGEQATITLTAATDEDGTIASYIYERLVDGGEEWVQIANVNSLTCQDTISEDWGTVAYRACAVDDTGVAGPYITSETYEVNAGWVVISGPAEAMGDKPAPFDLVFTMSVTGEYGTKGIEYAVSLDGESFKTGSVQAGESVTVHIDTRLLSSREHTIEVAASKDLFVPAVKRYTFNIPADVLPDGGKAGVFRSPDSGKPIFPTTLAQQVIGKGGVDLGTMMEQQTAAAIQMAVGSYTGTGTSGAEMPTKLALTFVPSLVLVVQGESSAPGLTWCGQPGGGDGLTFSLEGQILSWYASTAAAQLNESNKQYFYLAFGRKEGTA